MQLLKVLLRHLMRLAGLVLPVASSPELSCFMVDHTCERLTACSKRCRGLTSLLSNAQQAHD